jgi:hypothetical protein
MIKLIKMKEGEMMGHVAWLGEMRSVYNILVVSSDGKRRLGRLRCRREANMKMGNKKGLMWLSTGTSDGLM